MCDKEGKQDGSAGLCEEAAEGKIRQGNVRAKESPFEHLLGSATTKMTTDEIMALTRGEE